MFSTLTPSPEHRASRRMHKRRSISQPLILSFHSRHSSSGRMNLPGKITDVCAYGLGVEARATVAEIGELREAAECTAFLQAAGSDAPLLLSVKIAWIGLGDDPAASRNAMVYRIGFSCDRCSREELLAFRRLVGGQAAASFDSALEKLAIAQVF